MLKSRHALLVILLFTAITNGILGQDLTGDDLQLPGDSAIRAGADLDTPHDESKPARKTEKSTDDNQARAAEVTAIMQSSIVSVRTNNGFEIHGIPAKPVMLPINLFGAEVKIPWNTVSSVQFTENGGITLALKDGSRLNGYSLLEELELEKEWGSIRIQRFQLQAIDRTQLKSTRQSTFQSPGSQSQRGIPSGR